MTDVYFIDGQAVNGRDDWRHQPIPATPQSRVEGGFPGVGERFVSKGPIQPDDLVVTGFIEGAGASREARIIAMHNNIKAENVRKTSGATYTVKIHNHEWSNMELVEFNTTGLLKGIVENGIAKVRIPVRYAWRGLR